MCNSNWVLVLGLFSKTETFSKGNRGIMIEFFTNLLAYGEKINTERNLKEITHENLRFPYMILKFFTPCTNSLYTANILSQILQFSYISNNFKRFRNTYHSNISKSLLRLYFKTWFITKISVTCCYK